MFYGQIIDFRDFLLSLRVFLNSFFLSKEMGDPFILSALFPPPVCALLINLPSIPLAMSPPIKLTNPKIEPLLHNVNNPHS